MSYVYGHKKFCDDLEHMVGIRPGRFWTMMWRYITPITIFTIIVTSVGYRIYDPPKYMTYKQELVSNFVVIVSCAHSHSTFKAIRYLRYSHIFTIIVTSVGYRIYDSPKYMTYKQELVSQLVVSCAELKLLDTYVTPLYLQSS